MSTPTPQLRNEKRDARGRPVRVNARLTKRVIPGRWPSAALAMVVHGVFFSVLVFGVSWQITPPSPVMAQLWSKLPPMVATPPPLPVVEAVVEPPPPPPPPPVELTPPPPPPLVIEKTGPSKADIALKEKQERDAKLLKEQKLREVVEQKQREDAKKAEERKKADVERQRREEETRALADETNARDAAARLRAEAAAREADARNRAAAAAAAAQNDYAAKIAALIRSRANIPDTVMGRPLIQVRLRLLVNGAVFDAQIVRPSGNRVYDEAVERAINGIKQWPQPDKPDLVGSTREILLKIEHER